MEKKKSAKLLDKKIKYKVKKLFNGFASIRDHVLQRALKRKENLIIEYRGQRMTVPYSKLRNPFQIHKKEFRSKYNGKIYELYDFPFEPDKDQINIWESEKT
jgi:hypothetical protein|tara:strand:+ start:2655 stop:2960 length:306 start_codon:yes stop_codon:yes gene_type:complete